MLKSPLFALIVILGLAAAAGACAGTKRWEAELAAFAAADRALPARPEGSVVFVGSSSIRLWTSLAQDFPELNPVNRGFGGSEIADAVENFDVLVAPHAPRLVVFYAGSNDLAAGKTPAQVAADFERFCAKLHAAFPRARLLYLSIVAAPARVHLRDAVAETNRAIATLCAADARRAFVDVASPLHGAGDQPREELFVTDRLHLAPAGYAVWKEALSRHLSAEANPASDRASAVSVAP